MDLSLLRKGPPPRRRRDRRRTRRRRDRRRNRRRRTPNPTQTPTNYPTNYPTAYPTDRPTAMPSEYPTVNPTAFPTASPTEYPTDFPTESPTESPTDSPTDHPTSLPTNPKECKAWCAENTNPWNTKCDWRPCQVCDDCALPNHCEAWCRYDTKPWDTKCAWKSTCGGCANCAPDELPEACVGFYRDYCGRTWPSNDSTTLPRPGGVPTMDELRETFDSCCMQGGHHQSTCAAVDGEVFDGTFLHPTDAACDELVQLAGAHLDWASAHSHQAHSLLASNGELELSLKRKGPPPPPPPTRRRRERRRRERRRRDRRRRTPSPTTQSPTTSPTDSPSNSPTDSPTPAAGKWTITRTHSKWGGSREDVVCGESTDVLSIEARPSISCAEQHNGAAAWVVVNQQGKELTWGFYCDSQGNTEIVGTPTFAVDDTCLNSHNTIDDGY